MSDSSNTASGGIGLGGVLTVVFIVLKLAEVGWFASASWLWLPVFWLSGWFLLLSFVGALLGAVLFAAVFAQLLDWLTRGRTIR